MKSTATKSKSSVKAPTSAEFSPASADANRLNCVATAAYYNAEARGFMPGSELEDWLKAETEFDSKAGR